MREIVIASGKGGTGKTFIASNLTYYISQILGRPCTGVDADAEAPDLALALGDYVEIYSREEVYESRKASIDYDKCNLCMMCQSVCRFYAITIEEDRPVIIEEYCEGCGACGLVCPTEAITYRTVRTGYIIYGVTRHGARIVTSDLEVSGRNTGHLVYLAREKAKQVGNVEYIVIDAAPGIGCPVISSIVGANLLIICVEPTPQSFNGCCRLINVADTVKIPYRVIINKYDLNREFTEKIERELGNNVIGRVPYSREIVKSYADLTPLLATSSTLKRDLEQIMSEIVKVSS
ncbi:MAG: (4Fe-4S)-binding protein [Crenarchaeota archaeon]|nr:(4Fe-4S)-binding protein [Thermoproteota archaeon]